MNDFRELYKNYTTAELLNIIRTENEYQPEAIQTARMILEERNVSEAEIVEELKQEKTEQEENEQSTDEVVIKRTAKSVLPTILNPFIPSETDEEKNKNIIAILCILAGFVFFSSLPTNLHTIYIMLTEDVAKILVEMNTILSIVMPIMAAFLMYKGYKIGWYLFVFDYVFTFVSSIESYIIFLKYSGVALFDLNYFVFIKNTYDIVFDVCLCTGVITILCAKGIRNLYGIDSVLMKNCIILSILLSLLLFTL